MFSIDEFFPVKAWVIAVLILPLFSLSSAGVAAEPKAPTIRPNSEWLTAEKLQRKIDLPFRSMEQHKTKIDGIVVHMTETQFAFREGLNGLEKIIGHHNAHLKNIHKKFRQNLAGQAWAGFAYHYYIDTDGVIYQGRPVEYPADSGTDYDVAGKITVVLEGDFEGGWKKADAQQLERYKGKYLETRNITKTESGRLVTVTEYRWAANKPTVSQLTSLKKIVAWLAAKNRLSERNIFAHRDLTYKTEPVLIDGVKTDDRVRSRGNDGQSQKDRNATTCPGRNLEKELPGLRKYVSQMLASK